jgi:hypothetical protein
MKLKIDESRTSAEKYKNQLTLHGENEEAKPLM